jgi:hypothetical protein
MQLGDALDLPFHVLSAEFSSQGNVAIAVSNETPRHAYVIQNLGNPVLIDLGNVADSSSVVSVNSTGQAAVLTAPGQLQFLTSLLTVPVLSNAIPTSALLGVPTAGVVDDLGRCAILGTVDDANGALETLCADGSSQRILIQSGLRISAIALTNQGSDAIVADSTGQRVLRISNYATSASVSTLAGAADGITSPVGIQISGPLALIADTSTSSIFAIDLTGQSKTQVFLLTAAPAQLKVLADRSIALLTDPASPQFIIFDLQAMQSFFVPTN